MNEIFWKGIFFIPLVHLIQLNELNELNVFERKII